MVVSDLLPGPDQAPPCSAFTRQLGLQPWGSALSLDRIIVVDVALPWPKPALAHELLKPAVPSVTASTVSTRLFAGEPSSSGSAVELYERTGPNAGVWRWPINGGSASEIAAIIESIAATPLGGPHEASAVDSDATLLICTQGSHDNCCGVHGAALADEIDRSRPEWRVRRISHTGGHRFAPTCIVWPTGRMWAWADLALVNRIADRTVTGHDLITKCRGSIGFPTGPAQVAELAVRAERGVAFAETPVVEIDETSEVDEVVAVDGAASGPGDYVPIVCRVIAGGESWRVTVRRSGGVPTIACESPGGLPAKSGVAYTAEIG